MIENIRGVRDPFEMFKTHFILPESGTKGRAKIDELLSSDAEELVEAREETDKHISDMARRAIEAKKR